MGRHQRRRLLVMVPHVNGNLSIWRHCHLAATKGFGGSHGEHEPLLLKRGPRSSTSSSLVRAGASRDTGSVSSSLSLARGLRALHGLLVSQFRQFPVIIWAR